MLFSLFAVLQTARSFDNFLTATQLPSKTCETGFLVEGLCLPYCPSGYIIQNSDCTFDKNLALGLDFYSGQSVADLGLASRLESESEVFLESFKETISLGLTMAGFSYSVIQSSPSIGPVFSINLWLLALKPGPILTENSGRLKISVLENSGEFFMRVHVLQSSAEVYIRKGWNRVIIQGELLEKKLELKITIGELQVKSETDLVQGFDLSQLELTLGSKDFVGFVRKVEIFNKIIVESDGISLRDCQGIYRSGCIECEGGDCIKKCCGDEVGEENSSKRNMEVLGLFNISNVPSYGTSCYLFYTLSGTSSCLMNTTGKLALVFNLDSFGDTVFDSSSSMYSLVPSADVPLYGYFRGKYLNGISNYYTVSMNSQNLIAAVDLIFLIKLEHTSNLMILSGSDFGLYINGLSMNFNSTNANNMQVAFDISNISGSWSLFRVNLNQASFLTFTATIYMKSLLSGPVSKSTLLTTSNTYLALRGPIYLGGSPEQRNLKGWVYFFSVGIDTSLYNILTSFPTYTAFPPWSTDLGFFMDSDVSFSCSSSLINCKNNSTCSLCFDDLACTRCSGPQIQTCLSCSTYLARQYCFPECPLGSTPNGFECVFSDTYLTLSPDPNNNLVANSSALNLYTIKGDNYVNVSLRGTYFKNGSAHISANSVYLFEDFVTTYWIKIILNGTGSYNAVIGFINQTFNDKFGIFISNGSIQNPSQPISQEWTIIQKQIYVKSPPEYYKLNNYAVFRTTRTIVSTDVNFNSIQSTENSYYDDTISSKRELLRFQISLDSGVSLLLYHYSFYSAAIPQNNLIPISKINYFNKLTRPSGCSISAYAETSCPACSCPGCYNNLTCPSACVKNCISCDQTSQRCINCYQNLVLVNGLCMRSCPTFYLYSQQPPSCQQDVNVMLLTWDFNTVNSKVVPVANNGTLFNNYQISSTSTSNFQYKRGWYTNKLSIQTPMTISCFFGYAAWVKLTSALTFISTSDSSLVINLNSATMEVNFKGYMTQNSVNFTKGALFSKWIYFSFYIKNYYSTPTFILNAGNRDEQTSTVFNLMIPGSSLFYLGIGTSSFWIYKFYLATQSTISTAIIDNSTLNCGNFPDFCTWDCELNQYFTGGSCQNCMAGCSTCRNSASCEICADPLCARCNNVLNGTTCIACVANAGVSSNSQQCSCNSGYNLYQEIGICCVWPCTTCVNSTYQGCLSCPYKLNNFCIAPCPSYYTLIPGNPSTCTISTTSGFVLPLYNIPNTVFQTNHTALNFTYKENGVQANPRVGYQRGLYFFTNSSLTSSIDFILSNTFTLQGYIYLNKNTTFKFFNKIILSESYNSISRNLNINISMQAGSKLACSFTQVINNTFSWVFYSISVTTESSGLNIILYQNDQLIGSCTGATGYYFDNIPEPLKFSSTDSSFEGYIYQLAYSVLTIHSNSYPSLNTLNLWSCSFNQYFNGSSYSLCMTNCPICRYGNVCTQCYNPLCLNCSNFSSSATCYECDSSSINSTNDGVTNCSCLSTQVAIAGKCLNCNSACSSCSSPQYNNCTTCYYTINSRCTTACPTFYQKNAANVCMANPVTTSRFSFGSQASLTYQGAEVSDVTLSSINNVLLNVMPTVAYNRGLYLNSSSYLRSNNIILSNTFSVYLMLFVFRNGVILEKNSLNISATDGTLNANLSMQDMADPLKVSISVDRSKWFILLLTVKTDITTKVFTLTLNYQTSSNLNGQTRELSDSNTATSLFSYLDTSSQLSLNSLTLPSVYYLYMLKYSVNTIDQIPATELSQINTLWSCPPNQYFTGSTCSNCMSNCSTCRYNDTCSICNNQLCKTCASPEASCTECVDFTKMTENICSCISGYCPTGAFCRPCNPACLECFSPLYKDCKTCKLTLNNKCSNYCPIFYSKNDTSFCVPGDKTSAFLVFNTLNSNSFNTDNPLLSFTSNKIPYIGFSRGIYMNSSSLQSTTFLQFSNEFTIQIVMNVYIAGTILAKNAIAINIEGNSLNFYMTLQDISNNIKTPVNSINDYKFNEWVLLTVTYSAGSRMAGVSLKTNKNQNPLNNYFLDFNDNLIIGPFTGWVYSFYYSSDSNAPYYVNQQTPVLWNCPPGYYFNEKCVVCNNNCNCRRGTDCRACKDPFCDICNSTDSDICTTCMNNSIWVDASKTCNPCSPRYANCTYQLNSSYLCKPAFVKNYDNACLLYYGEPDILVNGKCVHSNTMLFSIKFQGISNIAVDGNYQFYLGVSDSYFPFYDNFDPIVLTNRGIYFGRSIATLGTYSAPYPLAIGTSYTAELYIMIKGPGTILTLSDRNTPFIQVAYNKNDTQGVLTISQSLTNTINSETLTLSTAVDLSTWYHVVWNMQFLSGTTVNLIINGKQVLSRTKENFFFNQPTNQIFYLGSIKDTCFLGFIYALSLFNYPVAANTPISPCLSEPCPKFDSLLSTCDYNQFQNATGCSPCLPNCVNGCSSNINCNIFIDPLCQSFKNLTSNCSVCVKGTVKDLYPCKCVNGSVYNISSNSCQCPGTQIVYNDRCDNCTRWIQQNEIDGFFDSSFMQIVFVFSIPVAKVPCEWLFNSTVISKLGLGYVCNYLNESRKLVITLGINNTIQAETVVINSNSLFGARQECGFNQTDLSLTLRFSAIFPVPTAVINVPNKVFIACQELVVDGSLSTGKLLGDLFYKWQILSNDQPMANINKDYPAPSIFTIPSKALSVGTILITLTVKNRFNYESSATASVILSDQGSIQVIFDNINQLACKQTSSCLFSISKVSSCISKPDYKYSWKLTNKHNFDNTTLTKFWKLQNIQDSIKIPSSMFPPSLLYFEIDVIETSTNTLAKSNLTIEVMPADIVISTDRTGGYISSLTDLVINSFLVTPVPPTANVTYSWSCFLQSSNCLFPFISNQSNIIIPAVYIQSRAFNKLTIEISVSYLIDEATSLIETVSDFLSLDFEIVTWPVVSVQIVNALTKKPQKLFKSTDKLSFKALINDTSDNYAYDWSVDGLDQSIFITPIDQSTVGINSASLTEGTFYHLTLSLKYLNADTNLYFHDFGLNSPPKFGVFNVKPATGVELETLFTFLTNDWESAFGNTPFTYIFGYTQNSVYYFLTQVSSLNSVSMTLVYISSEIKTFARVYDSIGDYSEVYFNITIEMNKNVNLSDTKSNMVSNLNTILYNDIPNALTNIASAVLNRDLYTSGKFTEPKSSDKQAMQDALTAVQQTVSSYVNSSLPSSQTIDVVSSIMQGMTKNPYLRSDDNFKNTSSIISDLISSTSSIGLNNEQATSLVKTVDNSISINSQTLYSGTNSVDTLHSTLNTINSALILNTLPGEVNSLVTNQLSILSTVQSSSNPTNTNFVLSSNSNVNIPEQLFLAMSSSGSSNFGISITGMQPVAGSTNSSSNSSANSTVGTPGAISLTVHHNNSSASQVHLTSGTFELEIPVKNAASLKTTACVYLNASNKWDSTGCQVHLVKASSIVCKCNHLSFFSAGDGTVGGGFFPSNNFDQTIDFGSLKNLNATSAIGFYLAGVIWALYIIIGIIVGKKDAIDMQEVIHKIDQRNVRRMVDNHDDSYNSSQNDDAIIVDSMVAEAEMLDKKDKKNDVIVKTKVRIKEFFYNIKFLKIFFLFDPRSFRLSVCSMIFTVLLGKMYFIGLFYNGSGGSDAKTIKEAIDNYSLRDFLVMLYSTVIMFVIELIIAYLTENTMINIKWSKDENLRIIKRNKWKRAGCLALCWALMIWFTWSIAMFAMNLDLSISYSWFVNTVTSYLGDLFFIPGIQVIFLKCIFPNLGLLLNVRYCFYYCWDRYKKKEKTGVDPSAEYDDYAVQSSDSLGKRTK